MEALQTLFVQLQSGNLPEMGLWSYLLLAILVAVEGPIATLFAAAAASTGLLQPPLVFVAAAAGNLTADSLWYFLGYAGRLDWLTKIGGKFGVQREQIENLTESMRENAVRILVIAKLTAGLVIPSLVAAGLVRVSWRRWFPALLPIEMLWTGSLVIIGYYAANAIRQVERGVEMIGVAGSVLLVLVILYGIRSTLRKKQRVPNIQHEHTN